METFDFIDYHDKIRQSLNRALAAADTDAELCLVMSDLLDQVEQDLSRHLTAQDREFVACAPGCGSCCMVNVAVLQPEAINIAHYLQQTRSAQELIDLKQRMKKMVTAISGLDEEERIALRCNCVFLSEQGRCTIYPVRPLLCRSITSTSAEACRDALTLQALGEQRPVMMNLFQKNLMNMAFQGLAGAMEHQGMNSQGLELTASTLALL